MENQKEPNRVVFEIKRVNCADAITLNAADTLYQVNLDKESALWNDQFYNTIVKLNTSIVNKEVGAIQYLDLLGTNGVIDADTIASTGWLYYNDENSAKANIRVKMTDYSYEREPLHLSQQFSDAWFAFDESDPVWTIIEGYFEQFARVSGNASLHRIRHAMQHLQHDCPGLPYVVSLDTLGQVTRGFFHVITIAFLTLNKKRRWDVTVHFERQEPRE